MTWLQSKRGNARTPAILGARSIYAGVGYYLLVLVGIASTGGSGGTAAVWLPTAFLLAATIRLKPVHAAPIFLAALLGNIVAMASLRPPPLLLAGVALANFVEAITAYVLMRRRGGAAFDISSNNSSLATLIVVGGVVAPSIAGVIAASFQWSVLSVSFTGRWVDWVTARSLGMLLGFPMFLLASEFARSVRDVSRATVVEWLLVFGLGIPVLLSIFWQSEYPLLFGASLFVLLAAVRLGVPGAVVATMMTGVIAIVLTYQGHGPLALISHGLQFEIRTLQLFLLCTFLGSLPIAAKLAAEKRMRAEVADNRDFVESVLHGLRDVAFRTDRDGRWTYLNAAWTDLTGHDVEQSLGNRTRDLLAPADKERASLDYAPLVRGETDELNLEQAFVRADGSIRSVETAINAIRDNAGRLLGTTGLIRDVTEAREAQQALERSERRFQTLTALSPAGIFRTDSAGKVTYVNDAWLSFAGIDSGFAYGDGWGVAIHPDDLARVTEEWLDAVHRKSTLKTQFRFRHGDGRIVWVMATSTPETDADGNLSGHIGVVIDFSDVVTAREALAAERERYKYLAENATDAIIAVGLDSICRYASPAIEELSGYTPPEVIGKPVSIPIDEEGLPRIEAAYARLFSGESDREVITYKVQHKTRGWLWNESHVKLVRGADGEPLETIASVRDITERVALEEELHRARHSAEAAAKAKSSFLANMSHEIRTPMNGVVGFADLLLESDLGDKERHYVELIGESGRSLVALINDILDISKIEAGHMTIVESEIDLVHAIRGTMRLMSAAAEKKGIALKTEFDIPDRPVLGDKLRLRQILSNLVGNAIKFTDHGAVTVRARLVAAGGHDQVVIEVEDTGRGIAPHRLETIFGEFEQEDDATGRRYGGTGLGLSISRNLATMMDGGISATSEPGKGAIFTLTLPYRPTERRAAPDAGRAASDKPLLDDVAPEGRRILVAEDHDINQLLIGSMLDKAGFPYELAADGLIAVDMVKEAAWAGNPFNLVLMDMQMPRADGMEATRSIREAGFPAEELPIIALTANAFESDQQDCLAAGMQAHLSKPVQFAILRTEIERWLPRRRKTEATAYAEKKLELGGRFAGFKREVAERADAVLTAFPDPGNDRLFALRDHAHKLAGTAAMFGEEELGDAASECEVAIEKAIAEGAPGDLGPVIEHLQALLHDTAGKRAGDG